jgi:chorismate dehydratase
MLRGERIQLNLDVPSECARKLILRTADFGLAPAGILPLIETDYECMDYCIAARKEVRTVMLFSRVPLNKITTILLDSDSRTSVLLVRILARDYWKIQPEWKHAVSREELERGEAVLAIGDKAFELHDQFPYVYDLASEWKMWTGKPFVFAIWVASKKADPELRQSVSDALDYGASHVMEAIAANDGRYNKNINLEDYLTRNIRFKMNPEFREGLNMYLDLIRSADFFKSADEVK